MTSPSTSTAHYEQLVAAIVKAIPERKEHLFLVDNRVPTDRCMFCDRNSDENSSSCSGEFRPITLEDVLRACNKKIGNGLIGIRFDNGRFVCFHRSGKGWNYPDTDGELPSWKGESLAWHRDNAPETITFLHSILV